MSSSVRNIVATTSPGLEKLLSLEISRLCPGSSVHVLPGRGVVCSTAAEIRGDVASASVPMWRLCLLSRLTDSLKVRLVEPTFCQWEKHFAELLRNAPWRNFIPLNSPMPEFKVKTDKSRLFHETHVAKVADEVLSQKRLNASHASLNRGGVPESSQSSESQILLSPSVSIFLIENELEVLVDAEGGVNRRVAVGEVSRAAISAAVDKSGVLADLSKAITVWDPFCGRGSLVLEIASIVSGLPIGSPLSPFPFTFYPTHAPESFRELIESINFRPMPGASRLTLLGTDSSGMAVDEANEGLGQMLAISPRRVGAGEALSCRVHFSKEQKIAEVVKELDGAVTSIFTVLPSDLGKREMLEFSSVVRSRPWRSVYVLCPRQSKFRAVSGLDWRIELRFTSTQQGRIFELLRLC